MKNTGRFVPRQSLLLTRVQTRKAVCALIGLAVAFSSTLAGARQSSADQVSTRTMPATIIAGYLEYAWLGDKPVRFEAKLDSGANSSSINIPDPKIFKRDGQDWVSLAMTNKQGEHFVQDARVVRYATIRRAGTPKTKRVVVLLKMCVAGKVVESEFTLADRTGQSFQVLVGRKFLKSGVLINSGAEYLHEQGCYGVGAKQ